MRVVRGVIPLIRIGFLEWSWRILVFIALGARSAKAPSLVEAQGLSREDAQREVGRLALGCQPVAAHDRGAGLIVDIDIGA